ncbi:MAG TPA: PEP-CTERM sorting domain-containing protein [Pirellulales bacterium]
MRFVVFRCCVSIIVATMFSPTASYGAIQVFTSRTAWEAAMGGASKVATETFDSFPLPTYLYTNGVVPVYDYQLPEGISQIGLLKIDVQRPSGNLIESGGADGAVNGTNSWRIETALQDGDTPPVSPSVQFDYSVTGFAADWYFPSTPDATITINGQTTDFSTYVSSGDHFLGFIDLSGFNHVDLSLTMPFNTIFAADNVSFSVPEPSTLVLAATAAFALMALRRRK